MTCISGNALLILFYIASILALHAVTQTQSHLDMQTAAFTPKRRVE